MSTIINEWNKQVDKDKSATAVIDENRTLTRGGLDKLADTIAAKLPGNAKRIGVVTDHSVEMIAAVFAALKIGAAYVPVEPTFPVKRIRYMMQDAAVDCVVTQQKYRELTENIPQVYVEQGAEVDGGASGKYPEIQPSDLAYVLYTSGSTGKPKGVAVEHGNVCHYVRAFQKEFRPSEKDVMLQYSVCSFDIFVEEVFAALLSGAALVIPSAGTKTSLTAVMEFVQKHGVTMISGFPYLLEEMNRLPGIPSSLRLLISGGDVLRASYVDQLIDKVPVYNTYGPSETTVCASYFKCEKSAVLADGTFPVGKPVAGTEIVIMNENLQPVEAGEVGEICISGGGVSRGYVGDLPQESAAFIVTKEGGRVYRSGDIGYLLPDGNIAFLHRKDSQIMIYGKRVERTEVENVLLQCKGVQRGYVKTMRDEKGLSYMTAYVVADEGVTLSSVKGHMRRYLADFMIPEFFVRVKDLPLTPNGKVDADALPDVWKEG